jgi:hypothetical protein
MRPFPFSRSRPFRQMRLFSQAYEAAQANSLSGTSQTVTLLDARRAGNFKTSESLEFARCPQWHRARIRRLSRLLKRGRRRDSETCDSEEPYHPGTFLDIIMYRSFHEIGMSKVPLLPNQFCCYLCQCAGPFQQQLVSICGPPLHYLQNLS